LRANLEKVVIKNGLEVNAHIRMQDQTLKQSGNVFLKYGNFNKINNKFEKHLKKINCNLSNSFNLKKVPLLESHEEF